MAKYDDRDVVTYYFVVNDDGRNSMIQGWTDNKDLAKFYMEFHKCKNFRLKNVTKTFDEIARIIEENNNDEIQIKNILTRDPKHPNRGKWMQIPITNTEISFVESEVRSLMASMVNYSFIESAMPYLKIKYQEVLKKIMLQDAINLTVHNMRSAAIESLMMDGVMVLLYSFPANFG